MRERLCLCYCVNPEWINENLNDGRTTSLWESVTILVTKRPLIVERRNDLLESGLMTHNQKKKAMPGGRPTFHSKISPCVTVYRANCETHSAETMVWL
jgi:hypothetical protein